MNNFNSLFLGILFVVNFFTAITLYSDVPNLYEIVLEKVACPFINETQEKFIAEAKIESLPPLVREDMLNKWHECKLSNIDKLNKEAFDTLVEDSSGSKLKKPLFQKLNKKEIGAMRALAKETPLDRDKAILAAVIAREAEMSSIQRNIPHEYSKATDFGLPANFPHKIQFDAPARFVLDTIGNWKVKYSDLDESISKLTSLKLLQEEGKLKAQLPYKKIIELFDPKYTSGSLSMEEARKLMNIIKKLTPLLNLITLKNFSDLPIKHFKNIFLQVYDILNTPNINELLKEPLSAWARMKGLSQNPPSKKPQEPRASNIEELLQEFEKDAIIKLIEKPNNSVAQEFLAFFNQVKAIFNPKK